MAIVLLSSWVTLSVAFCLAFLRAAARPRLSVYENGMAGFEDQHATEETPIAHPHVSTSVHAEPQALATS